MKRKTGLLFFIFVALILVSSTILPLKSEGAYKLVTYKKQFTAGTKITLAFDNKSISNPQLFIVHSYGKTLLDSKREGDKLLFDLPQIYSNKTGVVDWILVDKRKKIMNGFFEIIPFNSSNPKIENYIGPQSTSVGNCNYITYATTPLDPYDNPMQDSTTVIFKNYFGDTMTQQNIKSKNFIALEKFYSPTKSGVVLFSAECGHTITKEYDATIFPGIATDFTISFSRNHIYADGNQITTLTTSKISDEYGNIVSDGTMITFLIKDQNDNPLKSFGITKDGIASAKLLHPDHQEEFTVKAFVTGAGQSNTLCINYKSISRSIKYKIFIKNRTIVVGPLQSFIGQIVPDGIKVTLKIYNKNKLIDILQADSLNGKVIFTILEDYYPEKEYWFQIEVLGSTYKTKEIKYEIHKQ